LSWDLFEERENAVIWVFVPKSVHNEAVFCDECVSIHRRPNLRIFFRSCAPQNKGETWIKKAIAPKKEAFNSKNRLDLPCYFAFVRSFCKANCGVVLASDVDDLCQVFLLCDRRRRAAIAFWISLFWVAFTF